MGLDWYRWRKEQPGWRRGSATKGRRVAEPEGRNLEEDRGGGEGRQDGGGRLQQQETGSQNQQGGGSHNQGGERVKTPVGGAAKEREVEAASKAWIGVAGIGSSQKREQPGWRRGSAAMGRRVAEPAGRRLHNHGGGGTIASGDYGSQGEGVGSSQDGGRQQQQQRGGGSQYPQGGGWIGLDWIGVDWMGWDGIGLEYGIGLDGMGWV
jgi:hypothetical protein